MQALVEKDHEGFPIKTAAKKAKVTADEKYREKDARYRKRMIQHESVGQLTNREIYTNKFSKHSIFGLLLMVIIWLLPSQRRSYQKQDLESRDVGGDAVTGAENAAHSVTHETSTVHFLTGQVHCVQLLSDRGESKHLKHQCILKHFSWKLSMLSIFMTHEIHNMGLWRKSV